MRKKLTLGRTLTLHACASTISLRTYIIYILRGTDELLRIGHGTRRYLLQYCTPEHFLHPKDHVLNSLS